MGDLGKGPTTILPHSSLHPGYPCPEHRERDSLERSEQRLTYLAPNQYRVSAESIEPEISPLPLPYGGCQVNIGIPLPVYVR